MVEIKPMIGWKISCRKLFAKFIQDFPNKQIIVFNNKEFDDREDFLNYLNNKLDNCHLNYIEENNEEYIYIIVNPYYPSKFKKINNIIVKEFIDIPRNINDLIEKAENEIGMLLTVNLPAARIWCKLKNIEQKQ